MQYTHSVLLSGQLVLICDLIAFFCLPNTIHCTIHTTNTLQIGSWDPSDTLLTTISVPFPAQVGNNNSGGGNGSGSSSMGGGAGQVSVCIVM